MSDIVGTVVGGGILLIILFMIMQKSGMWNKLLNAVRSLIRLFKHIRRNT